MATNDATPLTAISDIKLRRLLSRLCTEQRELMEEIRALESAKDENAKAITELAKKNKLGKVLGDGWILLPPSPSKRLNKEKLLELGVTVAQIEGATVEVPGKSYSVRAAKEEEVLGSLSHR